MKKINFKTKYLVFLVMISFITIGTYYSYAIFVTKQLQENVISIKTMESDVIIKINDNNIYKSEAGTKKQVFLTITNNGNTLKYYEILFKKQDTNIKVYSDEEISGKVDSNEEKKIMVNIDNLSNSSVELEFVVNTKESEDLDSLIGYSHINKEENFDHTNANKPNMNNLNLIPVYYQSISEKEGYWYKTDISNKNNLWYDYDSGIWANAVLVNNANYEKYVNKEIGVEIEIGDILGFYVWIPRFKYTILTYDNYIGFERLYNVSFEKGKERTGTVDCIDKVSNNEDNHLYSEICSDTIYNKIYENLSTYTHPAFNDQEGFWVAKFLMGEGSSSVRSIPNTMYLKEDVEKAIELSESVINNKSHLLTNMEYGSILILTNSLYGKSGNDDYFDNDNFIFKRVYNNSYINEVTGCSTNYNNYSKNFISATSKTCIPYNDLTDETHYSNSINYKIGTIGPGASTTGTIYGVYDMANISGELTSAFALDYDGNMGIDAKYYDVYSYNEYLGKISSSRNINNLYRYKLGDGIREGFKKIREYGMWQNGILEQNEKVGVIIRGGNGDIKNTSIYTTSVKGLYYKAPFRVVIE